VEVRICDAQGTGAESDALCGLIAACVLQAARDEREGVPFRDPEPRLVEENLWRAIRYGMDGQLIDLERRAEEPARAALDRALAWTAPVRGEQRIDPVFPERNGAQRQLAARAAGAGLREVYAAAVDETRRTYAPSTPEVPAR
jgi:carboxylate-amine ligase